jgi:hypothetical protein
MCKEFGSARLGGVENADWLSCGGGREMNEDGPSSDILSDIVSAILTAER